MSRLGQKGVACGVGMMAAALLAAAGPALAADPAGPGAETLARKVSVADLDLDRAEGAQTALQRIEAAARQVCGSDWNRPLREARQVRACVASATAAGVADLAAPRVTALHAQRQERGESSFSVADVAD